eukprot:1039616-Rhodomonas_salina.3
MLLTHPCDPGGSDAPAMKFRFLRCSVHRADAQRHRAAAALPTSPLQRGSWKAGDGKRDPQVRTRTLHGNAMAETDILRRVRAQEGGGVAARDGDGNDFSL